MDNIVKKLIDQAKQWTGYLEKKSNAQLDHFTANSATTAYQIAPLSRNNHYYTLSLPEMQ